jgi:hypothetical protein
MLVRDVRTGLLMAVPDNRFSAVPYGAAGLGSFVPRGAAYAPGLGYHGVSPMHHGLGDPVGLPFLAALAPLASSLLPAIAGGVSSLLPSIGKIASSLPGVISDAAKAIPSIAQSAASTVAPAVALPPAAPAPDGAAALPPPPPVVALPPPPPMAHPNGSAMAPPTETVIAPVPVQGPDGQTRIVPMRVRRRRRRRARQRFGEMELAGWNGYGYVPLAPARAWGGFNGW